MTILDAVYVLFWLQDWALMFGAVGLLLLVVGAARLVVPGLVEAHRFVTAVRAEVAAPVDDMQPNAVELELLAEVVEERLAAGLEVPLPRLPASDEHLLDVAHIAGVVTP